MKILQISSHYDQGGAARIAACIHRQLRERGEESYVAYGRGKKQTDKRILQIDRAPEVYASALFDRVSGLSGTGNHLAAKRLLRFLQEVQPDVVHMHALHGYYVNIPALFRYLNRENIPCVWTFHDCYAFTGNCGYFFDCEKWKTGCGNCPYLHTYPASWFFDRTAYLWQKKKALFTAHTNLAIVTPSDWLTQEVKKSFLGEFACMTIHNGIDVQHTFYPRDRRKCREKYGYSESEKIVLGIAIGYDDPRKGAKYILDMAKALAQQVRVVLIGWEEKNNAMLEGTQNIQTLPVTENAEMLAEYYSLADVFVLPSLAENYATVSLESMACGTPVVGFASGGIPEQLAGRRGIAVTPKDGDAFTRAVREALSPDADLLRGEALADVIREENSVEQMTKQYCRVYERLIAGDFLTAR